jgi:TonB-dependent SusC/RagA subfamily outer membrane receptor
LLLNNDLRGEVEEPAFYFDPLEEKADSAMDILLMTQGWRRFTWKTITEGSYHAGYLPERATTVTGKVVDRKTGQPVQAEVSLMEISEQRRFAKLETNSDGRFVFLNVNPYAQNKILASAQGKNPESILVLIDEGGNISNRGISASLTDEDLLPVIIREKVKEAALPAADYHDNEAGAEDQDAVMVPDLMALEECVVVGYGVQKKSDVTGSIVSVAADELMNIANIEQALQGRAAGVMVYQHAAGTPGEAANIRIRGLSAIDADEPLYVVDGQAMTDLPDSKISPLGYLNPEDISSIEILKDVSATAIYGSRGANGVILITTKRHGHGQLNQRIKQPKPRHQVKDLPPRQFSRVREFYTPKYDRDNVVEERTDFRSTIYWNPSIETGRDGKTTIRFFNSDEITTFRAIAEGIGPKGLTGRRESTYFVRLPFAIETRIPAYLCFGDTANISILLKNNTGNVLRGSLKLNIPDHLQVIEILPENIELKPNEIKTLGLVCRIGNVAGKSELAISFHAEGLSDAVRQEIEVQPKGFPVGISLSGNETEKNFSFTISDPLDGSLSAVFTAYPNVTSDLMSGIESILREPYGCFEQTSSSTYPNIMVLDYLRETGTSNPSVYKKAMELIERGYERLVSYETITKGYEWFGHAPAHESLTAYGLMEFTDMKKVFPDVNDNMIRRTVNWLNSRRDGKGNFEMDAKALDSFGRASQKVSNAYIVYSLSEAGINDIAIEYDLALKEAFSSGDPYRICLLANAGFNLGENDDGEKLLSVMQHKLEKTSFENLSIDHSITRSYGKSLQIETASLYLMAQLKSDAVSETDIAKTVNYLINSRSYGGFGSTQATVLALKSLTGFAKHSKQAQSSGTISIHINGEPAWEESYAKGESAEISSDQLSACLKKGENYLTISFTGTDQALPYSFDASWTSLTPATSEHSRIDLKTGITQNMLKIGETSRLSIELINKTREGQPMTVALIGIPAGMSAQPWQLKELQEKGVFDYYEVRKNYLVLYYRQMKPSEKKQINLDLKAEVAGNYTAPSSSAYLYYTSEHKTWVAGTQVSIVR